MFSSIYNPSVLEISLLNGSPRQNSRRLGMRLGQRSCWDSRKLVERPWRYQHGIWL